MPALSTAQRALARKLAKCDRFEDPAIREGEQVFYYFTESKNEMRTLRALEAKGAVKLWDDPGGSPRVWAALYPVEKLHGKVKIKYDINHAFVPYRYGYVHEDFGGPEVLVWWKADDGPKVARNVVLYHGASHEQWIPRERLEQW